MSFQGQSNGQGYHPRQSSRLPPQGPPIGQPNEQDIRRAIQQANQELGFVDNCVYRYVAKIDQFGNTVMVPDVGSPADAAERLRLTQERMQQILARQHQQGLF